MERQIRLLNPNIEGLLKKIEPIEICLTDVLFPIQILCFSETYVKQRDEAKILIKDYKVEIS